ncbi:transcription factor bHLH19 [Spinacia oleracea]|uniref:Transcription factor bHLH19-like n=1 Tax=Spinacia oleracea TaxID=3562 RepID=A0A9R0JE21_SPIOL|nr:transcription factor bHLH19-like [Spinacia oleracea]XP_021865817.1 transcription factor bHLH19-like [Spinacia oleracea]
MEACRFVIRGKGNVEDDTATSNVGGTILSNSLPEIVFKVVDKTILLNIYCEKQKGTLTTILEEVENHDLSVVNCSMIPFDNFALDITIVAQMEKGFNLNQKNDLMKTLRSALVVASSEH